MNRKTGLLAGLLLALCIIAGGLFYLNHPKISAGEKEITVDVIHADQTEKTFTYRTDAKYLGEVLLEERLVEGEEGPYGLFIQTVDGKTADENKEEWWCITQNNEPVNNGADTLPIADGDQFELTLTVGY